MKFLEQDLEEIIFKSDKRKLEEKGLRISGTLFRQVRIGDYGIADLIEYNRPDHLYEDCHRVEIIELKKDNISISAFIQAVRYAKGVQRYFEKKNRNYKIRISITIIGKSINTNSDFIFIPDLFRSDFQYQGIDSVNFFTYKYNFDGISFENHRGYKIVDEQLEISYREKNYQNLRYE